MVKKKKMSKNAINISSQKSQGNGLFLIICPTDFVEYNVSYSNFHEKPRPLLASINLSRLTCENGFLSYLSLDTYCIGFAAKGEGFGFNKSWLRVFKIRQNNNVIFFTFKVGLTISKILLI
jgi:hypothetical protein